MGAITMTEVGLAQGRYLHADMETMPRERLAALQLSRLNATIANAHANVALHRKRLDAAGVDAASQEAFAACLHRFVGQGGTVVFVAHELGPLRPLITRAVGVHHGEIIHDGAPPEPAGHHAEPGHDHVHPHAAIEAPGLLGSA